MTRTEWITRGVIVMAVFGIWGQGCCGRRHKHRDAADMRDPGAYQAPGPQQAKATTPQAQPALPPAPTPAPKAD